MIMGSNVVIIEADKSDGKRKGGREGDENGWSGSKRGRGEMKRKRKSCRYVREDCGT